MPGPNTVWRLTNGSTLTPTTPVTLTWDNGQGLRFTRVISVDDKYVFSVQDTGIGIPADVIPRLFSAFTQANAGLARRYGGTGLGLAITKQLVELMNGSIEVQSAPGVGSEFIFRVPVVVGHANSDFAQLDELDMPSLHILVVDDNVTNLTVVENMLTAWGIRVTCAHDGQEALDILAQTPNLELVLSDFVMPGEVDGGQVTQHACQLGGIPKVRDKQG